jgi:hypothetical protein
MMIADWRRAWRLWSVRVSALGSLIFALLLAAPDQVLAIWSALPPELQAMIPNSRELGLFLLVGSTIARILKQRQASHGSR